jgi:putative DNA primase/helicase
MKTFDLDELFGSTPSKIQLSEDTEEYIPATFEEWCNIHGEPEYLGEPAPGWNTDIFVEDCDPVVVHHDTSNIMTEDKKGNQQLNYKAFVDVFAAVNECVFYNGAFYNPDGEISTQLIRKDIANSLGDMGMTSRLDVPTNALFTMLKDMYAVDELPVNEKIIPLANGDLHIDKDKWVFRLGEKKHAPYRLSVNYNPIDKPTPLFDKWLHDAFVPEDIDTIQEIMGYCLVPSTAAAEAFIIVGDGEAGKSGLGTILLGLLGNAAVSMETQDLVTKRFQVATVENKLVAYDDDLGSAALTDTNLFKKLITADTPIRAERKYADPHQFMSYCRIVASANFMLSSLYDDSDGFFRRLHPIHIKPKQPGRKVIRHFYETILAQEKEQILKWALVGLRRVIANGWRISWSQRSLDYMSKTKSSACHFEDFFKEACEVKEDGSNTTTAELVSVYRRWCKENGIKEMSERRLANWFSDNTEKLHIHRCENIKRNGKRLRGYEHLNIRNEWRNVVVI